MVRIIRVLIVAGIILLILAGQALARGGDSAGNTGTTETGTITSGGKTTGAPEGKVKEAGAGIGTGKATTITYAPLTGSMGSIYTGGWSGLGGGFIGDFGPQYNTYPCGFGMESVNLFGPLGMFGQYGMYGPFGMYGPSGPSFGSSLGFGGFGAHDPWALYKQANSGWAAQVEAATEAKAAAEKPAGPAPGQPGKGGTKEPARATTGDQATPPESPAERQGPAS